MRPLYPYPPHPSTASTITGPTVYVSNWASSRVEGHHGHRRRYGIIAPRSRWEHGDGQAPHFLMDPDLAAVIRDVGCDGWQTEYAATLHLTTRRGEALRPGYVHIRLGPPPHPDRWDSRACSTLRDGDTLCCTCSRDDAAAGRCHRVVVAHALAVHGWRVVLDGVALSSAHEKN